MYSVLLQSSNVAKTSSGKVTLSHSNGTLLTSIAYGELPGYTGWARPSITSAPLYEIESMTPKPHYANRYINIILKCPSCRNRSNAQFYVRMYGPNILGIATPLGRGRYEIKFLPRDEGSFWIEVVLTFSTVPDCNSFPLLKGKDPSYEGYLLPEFPLSVYIIGTNRLPLEDRLCQIQDLQVKSVYDGMKLGTWRVVHKNNARSRHTVRMNTTKNHISLRGYQEGHNSLGIFADYQPVNCNIIRDKDIGNVSFTLNSCLSNRLQNKSLRVVFIGDSVMRMQKEYFEQVINSSYVKVSWICIWGLIPAYDIFTSKIDGLRNSGEEVIILVNSGLHDISVLCSMNRQKDRESYMPQQFSCVEEYRSALTRLTEYISNYPARLRIFQTTSAGWMKWGNYGFAWNPTAAQAYPQSTHFVDVFNRIAFEVLFDFENIKIMDGYWLSLARPDNRQVSIDNAAGKHLVHPGLEVLGAMGRTWLTIVLSSLEC